MFCGFGDVLKTDVRNLNLHLKGRAIYRDINSLVNCYDKCENWNRVIMIIILV